VPEPSFDGPARASILDGAFDVPESDGKATSVPPASLESDDAEVPSAVGEEPILTPEEIGRRKRAYKAYLERRGLTPLRDVLGGLKDASETPAQR
jgi:hypothetical protein